MPNFSPPPTVTVLSKEISLDYGRTQAECVQSDYLKLNNKSR